jgi:hypothetical protein
MEIFDMLVLGVEAGFTLAGFAGIIATFQFAGAKQIHRADAVGLTLIVKDSFMAAAVCSLAMLLLAFEIAESDTWTLASLFAAVIGLFSLYSGYRIMRTALQNNSLRRQFRAVFAVSLLIILANFLNAADIMFHRTPGPILVAAVFMLGLAAHSFTRLLLLPVWRVVRSAEAAASEVPA